MIDCKAIIQSHILFHFIGYYNVGGTMEKNTWNLTYIFCLILFPHNNLDQTIINPVQYYHEPPVDVFWVFVGLFVFLDTIT